MAKNKFLSFVFPETTKKQIDAMPTPEMKLKFYIAVTNYGMYGIEPEDLSDMELLIWIPMKDLICNCKTSKGGAPEGNQNACKSTETEKNNLNNVDSEKTTETTKNNLNNVDFNKTTETTLNNHKGKGNDNLNDNHNLNHKGKGNENGCAENAPSAPPDYSLLQKKLFSLITEHNNSVSVESRIPISNNEISFAQKESREILEVMRGSTPEEVIHTVENLLKSAKERRKKKYSWYWFLQDINEYKPGFFIDDTKPDKEPLTVDSFCQLMMGKPGFNLSEFLSNQSKWLEAGCPQGDSYFALQKTWEVGNAAS